MFSAIEGPIRARHEIARAPCAIGTNFEALAGAEKADYGSHFRMSRAAKNLSQVIWLMTLTLVACFLIQPPARMRLKALSRLSRPGVSGGAFGVLFR